MHKTPPELRVQIGKSAKDHVGNSDRGVDRVANEVEQQQFIDLYQDLQHRLPADEAIYFADAVHPEYQTRPAHGWIKKGSNTAVKTTSGRKRVNIHGAVNLENFDTPFVEVTTVILSLGFTPNLNNALLIVFACSIYDAVEVGIH